MSTKELKKIVREKLNNNLSKQETYDEIDKLSRFRKFDIANKVRDYPTNLKKQKYNKLIKIIQILIILKIILTFIIPLFLKFDINNFSVSLIFILTLILVIFGINKYEKIAFSGAIFFSMISILVSIFSIPISQILNFLTIHLILIILIDLTIIVLILFIYLHFFKSYQINQKKGFDEYIFEK